LDLKKVEVYDVTGLLISVRERRERGVRWVSSPQEDQDLLGLVEKALSLSYCHGRYVHTRRTWWKREDLSPSTQGRGRYTQSAISGHQRE